MLPLQIPGLALAGRLLVTKYGSNPQPAKNKMQFKLFSMNGQRTSKLSVNPLQTIFKGISSALSRFTQKPPTEDYNTIVKDFLPPGAELLTPRNPPGLRKIHFADIDADAQNELIASFRQNNAVNTIILKKQNGIWSKAAEIKVPEYDTLKYRRIADITGEGKKQLLLGLGAEGKDSMLYGYSLQNGSIVKLFEHNYNKIQLLNTPTGKDSSSKARLAVWNKKDGVSYDIKLLQWNGTKLEASANSSPYYYRNVVPYYMQQVTQTPSSWTNWYNLAESLAKARMYNDAQIAVDVGMKQSSDPLIREKFTGLRSRIYTKDIDL